MEEKAAPRYAKEASRILGRGERVPDDELLLILRGEAIVSIMGIEVRTLRQGDTIGLLAYLRCNVKPSNCVIVASKIHPCDLMRIPYGPMDVAEQNEAMEDDLRKWTTAKRTLSGGPIYDQYGFATPYGSIFATDCIEKSEVFSVCSPEFVSQIPELVEDQCFYPGDILCNVGDPGDRMFFIQAGRVRLKVLGAEDEMKNAYDTVGDMACIGLINEQPSTAVAETHVWARVLYKPLLNRALSAFDGEGNRLTGARDSGAAGLFDD
jgi:signal-transduction protein with cAMP-binding, CBS, and nucleotidyltransferase domain